MLLVGSVAAVDVPELGEPETRDEVRRRLGEAGCELVYSPASDGGGFPADPTGRLPAARSVANMSDLYIDGDIYTIEDGKLARVIPAEGWNADPPPDGLLREPPTYRQMKSSGFPSKYTPSSWLMSEPRNPSERFVGETARTRRTAGT